MNKTGGSSLFRNYTFVDYATQAYNLVVALLILLFHNHTVPNWVNLLVIQGILVLVVHGLIVGEARRPHPILGFLRHFYPVLLFAWWYAQTGRINRMFFLHYLDEPFIRLEQYLFGCQPSVILMEKLPYLAVSEIFYASYFSYYLMIGGVGFYLLYKNREHFFHYVSVISFIFYICYLAYILLPIVGPPLFFNHVESHILPPEFQTFGQHTIPEPLTHGVFYRIIISIYEAVEAPGAAFPSSHVAIAWTTVYFSFRYIRKIWLLHAGLALLLTVSTVYCRYHYVLDVLAGGLTALALVPLANALYFRSIRSTTNATGSTGPAAPELTQTPSSYSR